MDEAVLRTASFEAQYSGSGANVRRTDVLVNRNSLDSRDSPMRNNAALARYLDTEGITLGGQAFITRPSYSS